jgi:hypothetical protein
MNNAGENRTLTHQHLWWGVLKCRQKSPLEKLCAAIRGGSWGKRAIALLINTIEFGGYVIALWDK